MLEFKCWDAQCWLEPAFQLCFVSSLPSCYGPTNTIILQAFKILQYHLYNIYTIPSMYNYYNTVDQRQISSYYKPSKYYNTIYTIFIQYRPYAITTILWTSDKYHNTTSLKQNITAAGKSTPHFFPDLTNLNPALFQYWFSIVSVLFQCCFSAVTVLL